MTGEVKIEKECVRMSHRTFIVVILGIISLTATAVFYMSRIENKIDRMCATMSVIVGSCCPEDTKRFFDGYKLGMAEDNNR